jgi:hypothetical protein
MREAEPSRKRHGWLLAAMLRARRRRPIDDANNMVGDGCEGGGKHLGLGHTASVRVEKEPVLLRLRGTAKVVVHQWQRQLECVVWQGIAE